MAIFEGLVGAPIADASTSTNPSKIANAYASERQMRYTNKTISNHIDYLADAFLISKAKVLAIFEGLVGAPIADASTSTRMPISSTFWILFLSITSFR